MIVRDKYKQEVKIGDWISTVPIGQRTVEVGKITEFNKLGFPKYKTHARATSKSVGKTRNYLNKTEAHFIKIKPTDTLDKLYEIR